MSTGHPSADKFAPIGAKPLEALPAENATRVAVFGSRNTNSRRHGAVSSPAPAAKERAAGLAACWMIAVVFLGIVGWLLGDMLRLLWR